MSPFRLATFLDFAQTRQQAGLGKKAAEPTLLIDLRHVKASKRNLVGTTVGAHEAPDLVKKRLGAVEAVIDGTLASVRLLVIFEKLSKFPRQVRLDDAFSIVPALLAR